jgi:hypothetical protein
MTTRISNRQHRRKPNIVLFTKPTMLARVTCRIFVYKYAVVFRPFLLQNVTSQNYMDLPFYIPTYTAYHDRRFENCTSRSAQLDP